MALDTAAALALVAQLQADAQKFHDIVHGDADTTVVVEGGEVDSLAKRIAAIAASLQDEVDAGVDSVSTLVDAAGAAATAASGYADEAEAQAVLSAPNRVAVDLGPYGAMDVALAGWFYRTIDAGGEDFTFTGWPAAGSVALVLLELTNPGAGALTWPAAVIWEGDTEPTWPAVGKAQITFNTRDGGTEIFASAVLYA